MQKCNKQVGSRASQLGSRNEGHRTEHGVEWLYRHVSYCVMAHSTYLVRA